jgi:hypothetical protein
MGFNEDLALANNPKVQLDFDIWYRSKFGEKVKIHRFDKNEEAQRIFGTDVVLILENGIRLSIDEKLRRNKYINFSNWCIELMSNAREGRKKLGWFYTSLAHFIVWGQLNEKDNGLFLDKTWMHPVNYAFKKYILEKQFEYPPFQYQGLNLTTGLLVPKKDIIKYCGENNCYQTTINESD